MEEAVTDTIIKGASQRIDSLNQVRSHLHQENEIYISNGQHFDGEYASKGVVNVESYVNKQKNAGNTESRANSQAVEE